MITYSIGVALHLVILEFLLFYTNSSSCSSRAFFKLLSSCLLISIRSLFTLFHLSGEFLKRQAAKHHWFVGPLNTALSNHSTLSGHRSSFCDYWICHRRSFDWPFWRGGWRSDWHALWLFILYTWKESAKTSLCMCFFAFWIDYLYRQYSAVSFCG